MSAQLIVAVHELLLPSETLPADGARKLSVRVEPADKNLVGGAVLQTEQFVLSEDGAAHVDWSHTIDVFPGGQAWEALHRSLASKGQEDSDIYFIVLDNGASLGEAYINLEQMLTIGRDVACESLKVIGTGDTVIGRLTVTVQGIAAMRLVESGARANRVMPPTMEAEEMNHGNPAVSGRATSLDRPIYLAPTLPPAMTSSTYALLPGEVGTPIRLLGSAELRVILRQRGIDIPERMESHSFYVDACRSHDLFTVTPAELRDTQALVEDETRRASTCASSSSASPTLVYSLSSSVMVIHVDDLVITGHHSRVPHAYLRIRVELAGMEGDKAVHTKAVRVAGTMRFDHSIDVRQGSAGWNAVAGALNSKDEEASDVCFTVLAEDTPTSLGEGFVNLKKDLLATEQDLQLYELEILDDHNSLQGHLRVSIHALSAMRAMQAPQVGSSTGIQQAPGGVRGELDVQVVVPAGCTGGGIVTVRHEGADFDAALPAGACPGETVTVAICSSSAAARMGGLTTPVDEHVIRRRHCRAHAAPQQSTVEAAAVNAASETLSRRRGRNLQPSMEELKSARGRIYSAQVHAEHKLLKSCDGDTERAARGQLEAAERELAQARVEQMRSKCASAGGDEQQERDMAAKALQARIRARNQRGSPTARRHASSPNGRSGGVGRGAGGRPPQNHQIPMPNTPNGRGAVQHQARPSSSDAATGVENTLVIAFERLGDAKAQLRLAQQSKDNLEKQLGAARREIVSLTRALATSRSECEQQRVIIAKHQLDRMGSGVAQRARQLPQAVGGAMARSASAAVGSRAGQMRLLKLRDSTQNQIRDMHRKLAGMQQAADTEQHLRRQAEHKSAGLEQHLLTLVAGINLEAQRLREETAQRALLEKTVLELRHELEQQAVMLEAEQEMRMALQAGKPSPIQRSHVMLGAHHSSSAVGAISTRRRSTTGAAPAAVVASPRRFGSHPRRGTKQEHAAASVIQQTWSKRSKAPRALLSSSMRSTRTGGSPTMRARIARPATTDTRRGRHRQPPSPLSVSMTDERRMTDAFSSGGSPLQVSRQGHKWTSERERNLALRLEHMAEELAVAISQQDRMHAVTQRYLLNQDESGRPSQSS